MFATVMILLTLALLLVERVIAMPSTRMSLEESYNRTLCPYNTRNNTSSHRIPYVIEEVKCLNIGESIIYVDAGGHHNRTCVCTEIEAKLPVAHRHPGRPEKLGFIHYAVGCACVNISSNPANVGNPNRVD